MGICRACRLGRSCDSMTAAAPSRSHALHYGPLETFIGFHVKLVQVSVYEDFFRGVPAPLSPSQFAVLTLIKHNPEAMQHELCAGLAIDKSTFSAMVDVLAKRKLLRALRSKADKRRSVIRLTTEGQATLKAMTAHVARHERRSFAALSKRERAQLTKLLKKVISPSSPASRH